MKRATYTGRSEEGRCLQYDDEVLIVCYRQTVWGVVAREGTFEMPKLLDSQPLGFQTHVTFPKDLSPNDQLYLFAETTPGRAAPRFLLTRQGETFTPEAVADDAFPGMTIGVPPPVEALPETYGHGH